MADETKDSAPRATVRAHCDRHGHHTAGCEACIEAVQRSVQNAVGGWCIVPNCDAEVIVHRYEKLRLADNGVQVEVEVPFCRGHGPKAGGSV